MIDLRFGDCLVEMRGIADDSIDAVVTDPPGGLAFMGNDWDKDKGGRDDWIRWLAVRMAEALRATKPGARALVWAIPRTSHWTGMAIEDAGWIIEDRISHLFGQGFPKAKSKLKPACEDWWLARKPSKNVPLLNIDDCRIGDSKRVPGSLSNVTGLTGYGERSGQTGQKLTDDGHNPNVGRWPANVTLTCCGEMPHLEGCPVAILDEQSGNCGGGNHTYRRPQPSGRVGAIYGGTPHQLQGKSIGKGDSGSAARFFYCSKASKRDRGERNTHPTVKPTKLLSWLIRLISNPGDTILDPFMGSGSTGMAAVLEGRSFIGIEDHEPYFAIAQRRLASHTPTLFEMA